MSACVLLAMLAVGCRGARGGRSSYGWSPSTKETVAQSAVWLAYAGAAAVAGAAFARRADRYRPDGASIPRDERAFYDYLQKCGEAPVEPELEADEVCVMRVPDLHRPNARCAYWCYEHCELHEPPLEDGDDAP